MYLNMSFKPCSKRGYMIEQNLDQLSEKAWKQDLREAETNFISSLLSKLSGYHILIQNSNEFQKSS